MRSSLQVLRGISEGDPLITKSIALLLFSGGPAGQTGSAGSGVLCRSAVLLLITVACTENNVSVGRIRGIGNELLELTWLVLVGD